MSVALEWLERPAAPATRVFEGRVEDTTVLELPDVDQPVTTEPSDGDSQAPAASSIAWEFGYRSGHRSGTCDGHAAGYKDGYAAGLEEALVQSRQATEELLRSVNDELLAALSEFARLTDAVNARSVELACDMARAILQRELAVATDPGSEAIRRAASMLPDDAADSLAVRLNPLDMERFVDDPGLVPGRTLTVIADSAVPTGGCVMDSGASRIDASIDGALDRVVSLLGGGRAGC